jgi:hypothetical protein
MEYRGFKDDLHDLICLWLDRGDLRYEIVEALNDAIREIEDGPDDQ